MRYSLVFILFVTQAFAGDWPQWRGPNHNGTTKETGLPAAWSGTENIKWRLPLPGPAPSTPVIFGDRIFLNSAEGDDLVLLAISTSGEQLWKQKLGAGNYDKREGESNAASPSPATDGKHIWTVIGTGFIGCFTYAGERIWGFDLQERYGEIEMWWGYSSSPFLDGDRLYVQLMHARAQYVIALNKTDGSEIWRHERETDASVESLHAYTTPLVYDYGGLRFLLIHGGDYVTAHRLDNGQELWRSGGFQSTDYNPYFRFIASPAIDDGYIVVPSAKNGPVVCIKPVDAKGNITTSAKDFHWKRSDNTPDVPSPLIHDGLVYLCRENGVLICLDATTGEEYYMERTHNARHRSSPVYADGKIYIVAYDGTVTVVKAGRKFEMLAQNKMGEIISATPAISNGTIYLRTQEALYAISISK